MIDAVASAIAVRAAAVLDVRDTDAARDVDGLSARMTSLDFVELLAILEEETGAELFSTPAVDARTLSDLAAVVSELADSSALQKFVAEWSERPSIA